CLLSLRVTDTAPTEISTLSLHDALPILSMFFFGAESIRGLLFAIIVGIVVGTYSSLFIATPIMYDTAKKKSIDDLIGKKEDEAADRKSTRLNSSHVKISYAVFCLKKKNK